MESIIARRINPIAEMLQSLLEHNWREKRHVDGTRTPLTAGDGTHDLAVLTQASSG